MGFRITFTMLDAYGRTTSRSYDNTKETLADALTQSSAMLALLEGVSGSAVAKYSIASVVAVASPSPEAGANNDAGATLHCLMDNGKMVGIKIPAIDPDLVNTDGTVKLSEAAITDFVGQFATGAFWRVSEGNYISSIRSGELDK